MHQPGTFSQRANTAFAVVYMAASFGIGAYQGATGDYYHMLTMAGACLLWPAIRLAERFLPGKRPIRAESCVLAFAFLAWTLGTGANWYGLIPGFDKIMHTLSGVLASMLGHALFLSLRRGKAGPEDRALAVVFVFACSMAVAGIWEIFEYTASCITGMDIQRVAEAGIHDTMQDMIVCLAGTAAYLPFLARSFRGKKGFLTRSAEELASYTYLTPAAHKQSGTI